jgi:glycosyltransferase involved in cell wall biosynthesis
VKLAIITPWPPDKSGIADYAYDLVKGLVRRGIRCTIFTLCEDPVQLDRCIVINDQDPDDWDLEDFHLRIYHFGNNTQFHRHMYAVLEKYPGVVHLHDYVLQHLRAGIAWEDDEWGDYYKEVEEIYGAAYSKYVQESWESGESVWERPNVIEYPLNEWVLQLATGLITHSHIARSRISQRFPALAQARLEQVYDIEQPSTEDNPSRRHVTGLRIGMFGHIQPNKCLHVLLEALQSYGRNSVPVVVRVVGAVVDEPYFQELEALAELLPDNVSFEHIGYVEEDVFLQELEACDLCVALRHPTMGETSAIVMRALQLHKLVVVTDTGWYSELPDFVIKVHDDSRGVLQLAEFIHRLTGDADYWEDLVQATAAFARQRLDYATVCGRFVELLYKFVELSKDPGNNDGIEDIMASQLAEMFTIMSLTSETDEEQLREDIYRKVMPVLPLYPQPPIDPPKA